MSAEATTTPHVHEEKLPPKAPGIVVDAKAVDAISRQLRKRGTPEASLRLGIRGGGCSGFTYVIEFHDGAPRPRDRVFDHVASDGTPVRVVVDPKSLIYLNGTTLEWEQTLMPGVQVRQPQRKNRLRLRHVLQRLSPLFTISA